MFLSHAREAGTEETRIVLQQQTVEQQQQKTKELESKIKYEPYPNLGKMGWDNMSRKRGRPE
jgi:hypothetical protein